jgi:hypothetical protein
VPLDKDGYCYNGGYSKMALGRIQGHPDILSGMVGSEKYGGMMPGGQARGY